MISCAMETVLVSTIETALVERREYYGSSTCTSKLQQITIFDVTTHTPSVPIC
jgi:hypothetical protein